MAGSENWLRRTLERIKYLVVHHSAADVDSTALAISQYHVSLGWSGIGYHYLIHFDGTIEYVGDLLTIRANVADRNDEVVGICLTGNFMDHSPTDDQTKALKQLLTDLLNTLPGRLIVGHKEIAYSYSSTSCPGNTWPNWKGTIIS